MENREQILKDIENMNNGITKQAVLVPVESVEPVVEAPVVNERSERMKKAWITRKAKAEAKKALEPVVEAPVEAPVVNERSERMKKAWATRRAKASGTKPEVSVEKAFKEIPKKAVEKATVSTLKECSAREVVKVPTGVKGLDEALGGGFVRNSAVLFAGMRGKGKSTLMTTVAGSMAEKKDVVERVLYVSGEEDKAQFAHRANRLKLPMTLENLYVLDQADIDLIDEYSDKIKPTMIIVDSIQSLKGKDMNGKWVANGRTSNYFTERLRLLRKKHKAILVLIGHETKNGDIAGDNALQHEVDVVMKLDPDPVTNARVLDIDKNRFAPDGTAFRFMILDNGIEQVSSIAKMEYKGPELIE